MVRKLEMSKVLKRVVLAEINDAEFKVKSLNTSDSDLKLIFKKLKIPSCKGMKEYSDLGIFENPNKFCISNLNQDNLYGRLISLFDVDYTVIDNKLSTIDEIDYKSGFKPNLALYYLKKEKNEEICIIPLKKKTFLLKDKTFVIPIGKDGLNTGIKMKEGVQNEVALKVEEFKNGLELPLSGIICKIIKNQEIQYSINVHDSVGLDSVLGLHTHIKEHATKVLNRFNATNGYKFLLTKDNVQVEIVGIESIVEILEQNSELTKSLALYKGHKNKTINRISRKNLEDAINILREHEQDEDCLYKAEDIPNFEQDKLVVSGTQIKIFTALLGNRIVEKILNKQIDLPFY